MRLSDLSPEDKAQIIADLEDERKSAIASKRIDDLLADIDAQYGNPKPVSCDKDEFLRPQSFRADEGDDQFQTALFSFDIDTKGDTLGFQRVSLIIDGKSGRQVFHLNSLCLKEFREAFRRHEVLVEAANDLKHQVDSPEDFGEPVKVGEEVFILGNLDVDDSPKFKFGQRGIVQDTNWRGLGLVLVAVVMPALGADGSLHKWNPDQPVIEVAYRPFHLQRVTDCSKEFQVEYDDNCRIKSAQHLPSAKKVLAALEAEDVKHFHNYKPFAVRSPLSRLAPQDS